MFENGWTPHFGGAKQLVGGQGFSVVCPLFCVFPVVSPGDLGLWTVVGGADRGGIIVRSERELGSEAVARLSTGALVPWKKLPPVIYWGLPKP